LCDCGRRDQHVRLARRRRSAVGHARAAGTRRPGAAGSLADASLDAHSGEVGFDGVHVGLRLWDRLGQDESILRGCREIFCFPSNTPAVRCKTVAVPAQQVIRSNLDGPARGSSPGPAQERLQTSARSQTSSGNRMSALVAPTPRWRGPDRASWHRCPAVRSPCADRNLGKRRRRSGACPRPCAAWP
jgi:hypothetical protein